VTEAALFFPHTAVGALEEVKQRGARELLERAGITIAAVVAPPSRVAWPAAWEHVPNHREATAEALGADSLREYSLHPERLFRNYAIDGLDTVIIPSAAAATGFDHLADWTVWRQLAALAAKATGRRVIVLPGGAGTGERYADGIVRTADVLAGIDPSDAAALSRIAGRTIPALGSLGFFATPQVGDESHRVTMSFRAAFHGQSKRPAAAGSDAEIAEFALRYARILARSRGALDVTLVSGRPEDETLHELIYRRLVERNDLISRARVLPSDAETQSWGSLLEPSQLCLTSNRDVAAAALSVGGAVVGFDATALPNEITAVRDLLDGRVPVARITSTDNSLTAAALRDVDVSGAVDAIRERAVAWIASRDDKDSRGSASALLRRFARQAPRVLSRQRTAPGASTPTTSVEQALRDVVAVGLEPVSRAPHSERIDPRQLETPGWVFGSNPPVSITPELDWHATATSSRTWGYRLHAWDFLGGLLDDENSPHFTTDIEWAAAIALSWARAFPNDDAHDTMAWYDMSLAARTNHLTRISAAYLQRFPTRRDEASQLVTLLIRHAEMLLREEAFTARTNHGVFAGLAGLSASRQFPSLEGMSELSRVSRDRLEEVTGGQFLPDGGHSEHSPDYHRMIVGLYSQALEAGLIAEGSLRDKLDLAEYALGWYIQPNGEILQLGDSPARNMRGSGRRAAHPTVRYLVTEGREGERDDRELFVLPETGVAIVRSPQPGPGEAHEASSYLSLQAGFHSRAHKHADDLAVTWFDVGEEILIDPGRYGYGQQLRSGSEQWKKGFFYADPRRQFIESTRAHSTVEADGEDHDRRERAPYGSALRGAVAAGGRFFVSGRVDHGGWSHDRRVVFSPRSWLHVRDELVSSDGSEHDFRAWWNLADRWRFDQEASGDQRAVFHTHDEQSRLWLLRLADGEVGKPVRAQEGPLRGWRSKVDGRLDPSWSLAVFARGERVVFETVFLISQAEPTAAVIAAIRRQAQGAGEAETPAHRG
jgi:hypothetical protein